MFERSRLTAHVLSLFRFVCIIAIFAATIAPSDLFAGQHHQQKKAARQARHQQKHPASTSSSSYTEIHRHQSR